MTRNTDNLAVSGTTLKEEFERLFAAGIIDETQARAMVECAISHSFISEHQKSKLRSQANARMGKD